MASQWNNRGTTLALFITGLALGIIGGVLALVAWPSAEAVKAVCDPYLTTCGTETSVQHSGSAIVAGAGLILSGMGQLMLFISLIAYGVRLGTE